MLRKGSAISQQANTAAQQHYLIAKVSITDFNITLQEKDTTRRKYLQSLRSFWIAYYEMR